MIRDNQISRQKEPNPVTMMLQPARLAAGCFVWIIHAGPQTDHTHM
jgi:hypothetical protein